MCTHIPLEFSASVDVRICCDTLPRVILLAFLSPYPTFCTISCFFPPRTARGRGCQSSCAPHLERSASTAKEPWVSVYLHGNAHDSLSPSVPQYTSAESSPPLVASRSCQEIFTADGSIKPCFTHGCQKNESLWKHRVSQVHTPARLISLLDVNLEPHLMDTFYIQMRLNSF